MQVWCSKLTPYINSLRALLPVVEGAMTTFTEGWSKQGCSSINADRAPSAILSINVGVGHPLYQILSFG